MPVRSLSRAIGGVAAAGALSLATAGAAFAAPAHPDTGDCSCGGARVSQHATTAGTDVAAPDQRNPLPAPVRPNVAAPPTWPVNAQVLAPPASSPSATAGFQWDYAGIGAGGALVVVLAGFGGAMAIRRRTMADPPLAA